VSFGGSSLAAVAAVNEEGGKVIGVQAIYSYGFPKVVARFAEAGVTLAALTSYDAVLESLALDRATRDVLVAWRERER